MHLHGGCLPTILRHLPPLPKNTTNPVHFDPLHSRPYHTPLPLPIATANPQWLLCTDNTCSGVHLRSDQMGQQTNISNLSHAVCTPGQLVPQTSHRVGEPVLHPHSSQNATKQPWVRHH